MLHSADSMGDLAIQAISHHLAVLDGSHSGMDLQSSCDDGVRCWRAGPSSSPSLPESAWSIPGPFPLVAALPHGHTGHGWGMSVLSCTGFASWHGLVCRTGALGKTPYSTECWRTVALEATSTPLPVRSAAPNEVLELGRRTSEHCFREPCFGEVEAAKFT